MEPLDLQLNGYKGVDFNSDDLSLPDLRRACQAVRDDGGGRVLATVITDRLDRMAARIGRLSILRQADPLVRSVVAGIHVEGPFINPQRGFVGAHPTRHVLPASISAAERLVAAGEGCVRLLTLAPEQDHNFATTRWLIDQGIRVSAGHCDPSLDALRQAVAAGLSSFTHLGNGCPLYLHRHDNIIYRVLATQDLPWVMVIADGVHLPPTLLRLLIQTVGVERVIAVTDATAAGGMPPGHYRLGNQVVRVAESGAAWASDKSHLVGSTASMGRLRQVLAEDVGLAAAAIERVTVTNPTRLLG